jgi:imidazolonepropionase-like amidohydrolase
VLLLAGCSAGAPGPTAGAPASDTVALTGARLIDGTGRAPLEAATIVVADGRIQAAGPADAVAVPEGASRIDLSGKTVMPGIINAHAHLNNGDPSLAPLDQVRSQLRLYARYGVTTVQSLGSDGAGAGEANVAVRNEQAAGPFEGARLLVSGVGLTPGTVEEARTSVDGHADLGVDMIKTRLEGGPGDMTPEVFTALIARAHERDLRVAAHIFYLDDARGLVEAGVDVLAHSVRDQDVDDAFVERLAGQGVGYIPTLTRDLSVFVYETRPAFFDDPFFLRGRDAYQAQMAQLLDSGLQARTRDSADAQAIKPALGQALRNLKRLSDGGVTIGLGTDSGTSLGRWQGYFEHHELAMMVEDAGLTPMEALVAATSGAARVLARDDIGTLAPGNRADLLVLDANPLDDIRNTRRIAAVWVAGRQLPLPVAGTAADDGAAE